MDADDLLPAAFAGDPDALEQVLGSIVAPLFDLALHLHRDAARAERETIAALEALVEDFERGALPLKEPLDAAARHLLAAGGGPEDPAGTPALTPLQRELDRLLPDERRAVVVALSLDAAGEELAAILGMDPAAAGAACRSGLEKLGTTPERLRDRFDEDAARAPLPRGMIERVLEG